MNSILNSGLLTLALVLGALGLGGHLYMTASDFGPAGNAADSLATGGPWAAEVVVADAASSKDESYTNVIERPLFAATRRPPPPRPQAAPVEIAPPVTKVSAPEPRKEIKTGQFVLIGVVIENGAKRALLRQGRAQDVIRVLENDEVDGWVAERIEPHAVRFVQDGVVDIVSLYDSDRPAPAAKLPPALRAPQARPAGEAPQQQAQPPRHSLERLKPRFKHDERQARAGDRVEAQLIPVRVRVAGAVR